MDRTGGTAAAHVRPATWRLLSAVLLAAVLVAVLTSGASGAAAAVPSNAGSAVATARVLSGLAPAPAASPQVVASLPDEAKRLSALLGVAMDRDDAARRIAAARLSPATQAVLAGLLARLTACTGATHQLLGRTPLPALAAGAPADTAALHGCALDLHADAAAAVTALGATPAEEEALRLWPVLAYSPDETAGDLYREDYALLVDRGGDDRYRNNQGANTLDLKRSLTSEAARVRRAARGCEAVFPDFTTGRIKRGPAGERVLSFDGPECSAAAALLLDLGGDDSYGETARPSFPDSICTRDHVVRRITTIGSGIAGVGMLIDDGGDDVYLGKTGTQGAGHLGGVGVHEDRGAGNDRYLAIRGAQGLGLLGGVGVLRDDGGDDTYDYRMPRPRNPRAPNHTDGAGGVVDDTGLGSEAGLGQQPGDGVGGTCDRLERSLQGVGLLAGVGVFVDAAGADEYRAPGYLNQPFFTLQGATIHLAHGSQGSGYLGGSGLFADLAGRDRYRDGDGRRSSSRADGMTIGPRVNPSLDEEGPGNGKPLDLSMFHDSGG